MTNSNSIRHFILSKVYPFYKQHGKGNVVDPMQILQMGEFVKEEFFSELNKLLAEKLILGYDYENQGVLIEINPEKSSEIEQYIKEFATGSEIFIIHGHNDNYKNEVARFVEKELRREAIILHEQANLGKTIIEKLEMHSNVGFAIAIWTGDDEGQSIKEKILRRRARQNVVFETGYFVSKLGRKNVVILNEEDVEIPSDYAGVISISLNADWKFKILTEFKNLSV